eukprot:m.372292 g.372292  ORF g.372292 m.372292 type:complete len:455 (+) comp16688_c0_seq14:2906-4270(+)
MTADVQSSLNSRGFSVIDGGSLNVGSLGWRAPEIFDAKACDYTMASDVYAFGIVMFEVVTRRLPWMAELEEWKSRDEENRDIGLTAVPQSDFDFVKMSVQDGRRPHLPVHQAPEQFRQIINRCWAPILTTRPLLDSANESETIGSQIQAAWEEIQQQSITLDVHWGCTVEEVSVVPHATHKEIKDSLLKIAGLDGRPIDTVALFKAQDHEDERVQCSYNGLSWIVDDKHCATVVLRTDLSPEIRANERGDASRFWKPEDGENPICISPPAGLFQKSGQSGSNKKDPEYMKTFVGAMVCGTWRITEYLSEGGSGRGWECVHETTRQRGFLKTFRTAEDRGIDSTKHERALQREIEALLHPRFRDPTNHPSIAQLVLYYGRAELNDTCVDGLYCIVSPNLAIGDLHQFLCPGKLVQSFSPNETRSLFGMIGRGVAFLHEKGLYHRDLKPNNIIIRR